LSRSATSLTRARSAATSDGEETKMRRMRSDKSAPGYQPYDSYCKRDANAMSGRKKPDDTMATSRCRIAAILLLAGVCAADAAPNIPSSELPGRERQRFNQSPVERFMQPNPQRVEPLVEWQC